MNNAVLNIDYTFLTWLFLLVFGRACIFFNIYLWGLVNFSHC